MNNPELYTKFNFATNQFADSCTKEYEDEIGEMSGRCIDIGSGPGNVAVDLVLPKLKPEATIVCSDISDAMVEFGKKKYGDNQRVSFIKLDIETPDLPKDLIEQFDHATSFFCLHWCRDLRKVFENVFNLLRPEGTILLTFIANFPGMDAYEELARMPRYQPYMEDVDRYIPVFQHSTDPKRTFEALIEDVGFEVKHCSIREQSYTYDNLHVFGKFMLAVNPFIDRIPVDLKEEYEKDLIERITRRSVIYKKNNNNGCGYSVLSMYRTFIVFLKKPLSKKCSN